VDAGSDAAAAAEFGAAGAVDAQAAAAAAAAGVVAGDGSSMAVKQEAAAVDWMHTPEEQQQHRAVRPRAGRPGECAQRLCIRCAITIGGMVVWVS
jgi:hypothetical protein